MAIKCLKLFSGAKQTDQKIHWDEQTRIENPKKRIEKTASSTTY